MDARTQGTVSLFFQRNTALFLCLLFLPGCISVTMIRHRRGNEITPEKVAVIHSAESTLDDVLENLGAPIEYQRHTDGLILVYRTRAHNVAEYGIDVGRLVSWTDQGQTYSSLLNNLKFIYGNYATDEDRVVVIIGNDQLVKGIAYRGAINDLQKF